MRSKRKAADPLRSNSFSSARQVLTLQATLEEHHSLAEKSLLQLAGKVSVAGQEKAEIYHLAVVPPDVTFSDYNSMPDIVAGKVAWAKSRNDKVNFLKK